VTRYDQNATKIKKNKLLRSVKELLIGGWFVSLKPGRAQLNARIVKVFCKALYDDSIGLAPFLERIYNHSGHKRQNVPRQQYAIKMTIK
jgi:hypothetical protein